MIKTGGSIEINNNEDMLFTYDENEKQDIEIAKANSQLIYSPKFIPMYLDLLNEYTLTEALLIGFIDFYKSSSGGRMYFTNEQLGSILKCSSDTISRSISKIEKNGLIKTSRKIKAGGGQIRFITECNYNKHYDSTFSTSHSRQNLQAGFVENLQTNNNNINNNKINTSSLSSNEDSSLVSDTLQNNNIIVKIDNKLNNELVNIDNNKVTCSNKKEKNKIKKDEIENRDMVFETLWDWYCEQNTKKQTEMKQARVYFDRLIKTKYDLDLLRYALPRYISSITNKQYLVLLRTYLSKESYLDYKSEFDNLNKPKEVKVEDIEEFKENNVELKFKRTYEN